MGKLSAAEKRDSDLEAQLQESVLNIQALERRVQQLQKGSTVQ